MKKQKKKKAKYIHESFIDKVSMRRKEYIKKLYGRKKGKIYQTVYIPPLLY